MLSLGEMAFAAHKAANRNSQIRGFIYLSLLDEAVGAITSMPEEGNWVLFLRLCSPRVSGV